MGGLRTRSKQRSAREPRVRCRSHPPSEVLGFRALWFLGLCFPLAFEDPPSPLNPRRLPEAAQCPRALARPAPPLREAPAPHPGRVHRGGSPPLCDFLVRLLLPPMECAHFRGFEALGVQPFTLEAAFGSICAERASLPEGLLQESSASGHHGYSRYLRILIRER